eukprot:TRINITY_DN14414_c0_g2_i1.p1 TRINITY_DN14414_c0_g2~~TRINITY_DN14414_c0_g2_i1.p1  ORF type:complete len:178 (+),score=28.01 TRINITY_DN14414_c0_g2_i1:278-811(+)
MSRVYVSILVILTASLLSVSTVEASVSCALCKKVAPYVAGPVCKDQCQQAWKWTQHECGRLCTALVKNHPDTACYVAGFCKPEDPAAKSSNTLALGSASTKDKNTGRKSGPSWTSLIVIATVVCSLIGGIVYYRRTHKETKYGYNNLSYSPPPANTAVPLLHQDDSSGEPESSALQV